MAELKDYRGFLNAGYSWRELFANYFRLVLYSRFTSALKHSFAHRGRGVVIDYTTNVQGAKYNSIGDRSWVQRYCHLSVPLIEMARPPTTVPLKIGARVQVGRGCFFAAANIVEINDDALFGPNVYVADHTHAFENIKTSIRDQGLGGFGAVYIERGSWIGINAVIIAICGKEIRVGEGAVVSANSVVTRSVPAHTMVAGVPARIIKRFDPTTSAWVAANE